MTAGRSPAGTTRWWPPGTAWPVAALAETGALLERPDLVRAAERAAGLLLDLHLVDLHLIDPHLVGGRLRRVSRGGVVGAPAGVLEGLRRRVRRPAGAATG